MRRSPIAQALNWTYAVALLALLYLPLLPPLLTSVSPTGRNPALAGLTLEWYGELSKNPVLIGSIETSVRAMSTLERTMVSRCAAVSFDMMAISAFSMPDRRISRGDFSRSARNADISLLACVASRPTLAVLGMRCLRPQAAISKIAAANSVIGTDSANNTAK